MFERNGRDYFEHVQPRYKVTDRIGDRAAQTFGLEPCAIIFHEYTDYSEYFEKLVPRVSESL